MTENKNKEKNNRTLPGDQLGVIEEYFPGENVVNDNGTLLSAVTGKVNRDEDKHEISVKSTIKTPPKLEKGDIIVGRIDGVRDSICFVDMVRKLGDLDRDLPTSASGTIHISNVSNDYIESMQDQFRIGDIIRARVTDVTKEYVDLSTEGKSLGVVAGYCVKCRSRLQRKGNKLKCPECNHTEKRKISKYYRSKEALRWQKKNKKKKKK